MYKCIDEKNWCKPKQVCNLSMMSHPAWNLETMAWIFATMYLFLSTSMAWILHHKVFHPMLLLLTLQHELVATAGPILDNSPFVVDLLDKDIFTFDAESPWELYIDGASRIETDMWAPIDF
jgi:hypothetical protein